MSPASRNDRVLEEVVRRLRSRFRCHTAILYGSRARGATGPTSDYDIVGVRKSGPALQWGDVIRDRYVDVFVYPEAKVARPDESLLSMRDGVVLFEKGRIGSRFLERLRHIDARGPKRIDPLEARMKAVWTRKMLDRIRLGGAVADYRRLQLLSQLLEEWFFFRRRWYRGPKEALATLAAEDPRTHALFVKAMSRGHGDRGLEALVDRVTRAKSASPHARRARS